MPSTRSKEDQLASHPEGIPAAANFAVVTTELQPLNDGEVLCIRGGTFSYKEQSPQPGPTLLFNITTKPLSMKGLIVGGWISDRAEFEQEVSSCFKAGKLKPRETVVKGIDHAVVAFLGLPAAC